MKILIISDGKYGDRAVEIIKEEFPETKMLIIEEQDPRMLLDEVELPEDVEQSINESDLIISYVRHPDVASELCYQGKPVILGINFGEGFLRQLQEDNLLVEMPSSMCHLLPNSRSPVINAFANKFGKPQYLVDLEGLTIKDMQLLVQSPCGASKAALKFLVGKEINATNLNEFALYVRQECREPLSIILRVGQLAEVSTVNHVQSLLDGIEQASPSLLEPGTELHEYRARFQPS